MNQNKKSKAVLVWFPKELVDALDMTAKKMDSDRSKLIRIAAREKLLAVEKGATRFALAEIGK